MIIQLPLMNINYRFWRRCVCWRKLWTNSNLFKHFQN